MKDFIIKNLTKIINIFLVVIVCLVAIFLPHTRSVVENSPYSDNQKTARIDISNEGFEGSSLEIVRLSDSNSIVRFYFLLVQEVKFLQKLLLYLQFFLFFLAFQKEL